MVLGVVGLGLMGGSFALSARKLSLFSKIVGVDRNEVHTQEALSLGIVDEIVEFKGLKECDVILLAIPIKGIISSLKELSKLKIKENTTIIDFGSTKETIISSIPKNIRKNLVASHPMAGTEFSGPIAAQENLYKNKIIVISDIENSGEVQKDIAIKIFSQMDMLIKFMTPREHDRHAAFISHMPHIVSYSIANSVLKQEDKAHIVALAGGGFRDMSRLAKSSPEMWKDIFIENRDNLIDSLNAFRDEIKIARKMIKNEKWDELYNWMQTGNRLYDIYKS
jgi:prephenate dehydrogenase